MNKKAVRVPVRTSKKIVPMNLQNSRPYFFPLIPETGRDTHDSFFIPKGYFYHLKEVRIIKADEMTYTINSVSRSLLAMSQPIKANLISTAINSVTTVLKYDQMFNDADAIQVKTQNNTGAKICLFGYLIPSNSIMRGQ